MLEVNTKKLDTVAVLYLQGQVVNRDTEILRDVVLSLSGIRAIMLDFTQVTTVDARGLGVLLELREWTRARGIRFQLMNVGRLVMRVFELTRLDSVFQITSRVEFFPASSRSLQAPMAALKPCA
jgi:anti-anti-sigma factor